MCASIAWNCHLRTGRFARRRRANGTFLLPGQTASDGPRGRIGAVGDAKLVEDVADVATYRMRADHQGIGDYKVLYGIKTWRNKSSVRLCNGEILGVEMEKVAS